MGSCTMIAAGEQETGEKCLMLSGQYTNGYCVRCISLLLDINTVDYLVYGEMNADRVVNHYR